MKKEFRSVNSSWLAVFPRQKSKKHISGFTLIELLVVIAIIGVLSQVILSSLNEARAKGGDANIRSNLAGLRASAATKYDDLSNTYNNTGTDVLTNTCDGVTTAGTILEVLNINRAITDAVLKSGNGDATCNISVEEYAIAVPLKTNAAEFWCIDATSKGVLLNSRPLGFICE